MEIIHADYQVHYNEATATIPCQGSLRLRDATAYQAILDLLTQAATTQAATLTLDVSALRFLNTMGINTFSQFILLMRQQPKRIVFPALRFVKQRRDTNQKNHIHQKDRG